MFSYDLKVDETFIFECLPKDQLYLLKSQLYNTPMYSEASSILFMLLLKLCLLRNITAIKDLTFTENKFLTRNLVVAR